MFVNFRVENFKSYKDYSEFSMEATKLKNLVTSNTFKVNNLPLLKSAVIYGSNASGKTNLLNAMINMKEIVLNSLNIEKISQYPSQSFLLNTKTENKPSIFEMEFIIEETLYKYGYSIYEKGLVEEEWLEQKKLSSHSRWVQLFVRNKSEITLGNSFPEGKKLEDKTRKNSLFIPVVAQFNGKKSKKILDWFKHLNIISNLKSNEFEHISYKKLDDTKFKNKMISLIKNADIGLSNINKHVIKFDDLNINNKELENLPSFVIEDLKNNGINNIQTSHIKYTEDNSFKEFVTFELDSESAGTKKLLALSAPIIDTLETGGILIVDELDNSLHTKLVNAIIELFNSSELNQNNAQLIFTTHDTNLLNQNLFRRDQIWFTEKDIYGDSEIYSLVEYGKGRIRDDLALEKNYLDGKFGAKPNISSLLDEGEEDGE